MKVEKGPMGKKKKNIQLRSIFLCARAVLEDFLVEAFAVLIADLQFKLNLFPGKRRSIFEDIQCVLIFR